MSVGADARWMGHGTWSRAGGRPEAAVVWAVAVLTALAAALRFYAIGRQGFWYDEATTALLVHFSPGKMIGLIPQTESTPPLYYCVAWVWARLFGDGEAGLRSLSALAGVAVVPVAYAAAATLLDRRAGVIAAALTACSPLLVWYSQEARSYELLVLLSGLALLACARARARPDTRRLALWAIACALALASHYFAVAAVVPQAVWLLAARGGLGRVRAAVAVVAACGLALIPLALAQNGTGHDHWIAHAPLTPRLAQVLPQFLIGTDLPVRHVLKFVAFALAGVALGLLVVRGQRSARAAAARCAALAVGGFALALVAIVIGFDDLITRNLLELWLPAAIVVAAGLAARRARWLGATLTAGLCAIGVFAVLSIDADHRLQRPDWRPVAAALHAEAPPPARAILIQHYRDLLPLSLYLHGLHVLRRPTEVSALDIIAVSSPSQPLCWWGAACNLIPSRMQARYPIAGLHPAGRLRVRQFTIQRLAARGSAPVRLTRAEVAAALTATRLGHDLLLVQRR